MLRWSAMASMSGDDAERRSGSECTSARWLGGQDIQFRFCGSDSPENGLKEGRYFFSEAQIVSNGADVVDA